nr:uncharacterized protein LOC112060663 [Chrysemys picta bellii]
MRGDSRSLDQFYFCVHNYKDLPGGPSVQIEQGATLSHGGNYTCIEWVSGTGRSYLAISPMTYVAILGDSKCHPTPPPVVHVVATSGPYCSIGEHLYLMYGLDTSAYGRGWTTGPPPELQLPAGPRAPIVLCGSGWRVRIPAWTRVGAEALGGPGDGVAPREGAPRRGLPPDVLRPVCGDLEIRHPARAPPEECEDDPRELAVVPASGGDRGKAQRVRTGAGVAQLGLQMEMAQREVMADEVSLEAGQEWICNTQRRSLLLKAYAACTTKERQQLQGSVTQLGVRLEQLQDISRKAKVELTVGGKVPDL